ncbi:MAG: tetratricopeptide repeat protein [Pirellulaceae bacterium]
MPTRRTCYGSPRAAIARQLAAAYRGAVLFTVGLLLASTGCRALRCYRGSDEAVASARQLSLDAVAARERGRWDQAEMLYADAIGQCPRDERARCGYAESLWQRGAQQEAVAHMEAGVRLSGHDPDRLVQLGEMYLTRGDLPGAAQQADRAIDANRQLASAWALRGKVLHAQESTTEALASFHHALMLQPQYAEVQLALAEIYSRQDRPLRALTTLQSLADSFPPEQVPVEVLVQQGFALRRLGRFQDAARALANATGKSNATAELFYELGRTQLLAGDAAAARLAVAAALERDPQHLGSLALQNELGAAQGMMAAALVPRM